MADDTDFLELYRKLHLEPGCTLAEFKQAYRRHVAAWHPDRRAGSRADVLAAARLQRLTTQYGVAMEFHRRHGRLPGSIAPPVARSSAPEAPPVTTTVASPLVESADELAPRRVLSPRWLVSIAITGIAVIAWSLMPAVSEPEDTAAIDTMVPPPRPAIPTVSIALGDGATQVRAIEGEPTREVDGRWEYGPSWIRFANGSVVDWYSSPLRQLHVPSSRPSR